MTVRRGGRGAAGRALQAHRGPLVAVAAVAFVSALLGGVAVPLTGALATAGTRADLARATPTERDLSATFAVTETGGAGPQQAFDGVADDLAAARRALPDLLRRTVGDGQYTGQSDALTLASAPSKDPAEVVLTADSGFDARTHLLAGRSPRPSTDPAAFEVVLSRDAARRMAWPIGTTRTASTQGSDAALTLVGTYAADDPADGHWDHVPSALRAAVVQRGPERVLHAVAVVAPRSFGAVAGDLRNTHGSAWFPLRVDAVTAGRRSALVAETRSALRSVTPLPTTASGAARFTTQLPAELEASSARDATVGTLTAALASGPGFAAVALQVLLARLLVERGRERWALLAARGADRRQRGAAAAVLAAVAAVPAAVVGAVAAGVVAVVTVGPAVAPVTSAAAVVVAALVAVAVPCLAAAAVVPGAAPTAPRRSARLVVEGAVLAVTAVAVVVTVRNGLATASAGGGVDPVAAVLPVLLGALGGVLALRLLPAALQAVAARARRRAPLAAAVGTATAARRTGDTAVPLAIAVVGIAVALFATAVGSTLGQGLTTAAHRSVAADVSVTAPGLDDDDVRAVGRVPGVAAVAGVSTTGSVRFDGADGTVRAAVIVADTTALHRVQIGVPGALPTPRALRTRGAEAVPVLASASLARAIGRTATVDGTRVRVVGTAPDAVPFTTSARWLLVDPTDADRITDTGSVDRVLVRVGPGASSSRVAAAVRASAASVTVRTAEDAERTLAADPRIPGVRTIAVVAAVLGGVFGAGALGAAGLLAGARRRERWRLLTVLGADPRDGRRLVVAETLPTLVTAVVTAVVVASAVVLLMLPAADLRTFTGSPVRPPVSLDPLLLTAVLAGTVAALAAVLGIEVLAGTGATRTRPRPRPRPRPRRRRSRP